MNLRHITLLTLIITSPLLAAERQRYLVATRAAAETSRLRVVANSASAAEHRTRAFRNVNAFAADLTPAEAEQLRASSEIESIHPVVERWALEQASVSTMAWENQIVPWGIDNVRAREVWPFTRGENVNVAVIDTGVSFDHPDLAHAWRGGIDVNHPERVPKGGHLHGTHVAGTIAAADNAFGVVGVAPGVRLWGVLVLGSNGAGSDESVVAGIDWVIEQAKTEGGRWVINLSLGASLPSEIERRALSIAFTRGIVVVAAAGNDGDASPHYPAAYPGVISVGAIDSANQRARFSSFGPNLAVMAPGVAVDSTVIRGTLSPVRLKAEGEAIAAWDVQGTPFNTVESEVVACGLGYAQDFTPAVRGKIALIERGLIPFREKARNAKEAGAAGVIIFDKDNVVWNTTWTLTGGPGPEWDDYEFPLTIGVNYADGQKLKAASGKVRISYECEDYQSLNGTSMAAPHVTGIVALMLSIAPDLSPAEVAWFLERSSTDISAEGWDFDTAWGRVDALRAAQAAAPERFGVPPPVEPRQTRRRAAR